MATEVADLYVLLSARTTGFTRAMQAAAKEGESFQSRIAKVAQAGKVVAMAGIVVGAASIKMAADFQSGLTLLQTAGGELPKNMKKVSDGILNLAESTGVSTKNLLEGAYIAEKAMYRGADMLNVLKAATQGAVAEHVDEATAVNALTSVMMSYGYKAKDAVSVENMLVKGAGMAKTTYQEFASSLSNVIPLASQLHVSFAQIAGAIDTLTQHGTSAQEATQELNNLLRNLSGANGVAVKAMNQLGISSVKVAQTLSFGPHGLQNALNMVVDGIEKHMGPSGLVMAGVMKKSAVAAQDLQDMLSQMPPPLEKLSQSFLDGNTSLTAYRKQTRAMGVDGYAMGAQFMALAAQAKGFSDQVKAGNPVALTFAQYLKQMLGGASGLNTALMLTGTSAGYFTTATNDAAAAGKRAGANISTWARTQATFNVKLDKAKAAVEVMAIKVGTKLIPVVESAATWMSKHTAVVKDLAIALGVTAAGAVVVWAGTVVASIAKAGIAMGKFAYGVVKWMLTPLRNMVTQTMETSRIVVAQSEEEAAATESSSARMIRAIEANKAAMLSQGATARTGAAEVTAADTEMAAANDAAAASGGRLSGIFKGIGGAGGGVFAGIIAGAMGEKYAFDQASTATAGMHSSLLKYANFASNFVIPGFGVLTDKLGLFGKNVDGAKFSTDDLTTALVNNQGSMDQVSQSWVQAQIQGTGLDKVAARNGVTVDQLTRAVLSGASAVNKLEQRWLSSKTISYQQVNTLSNLYRAYRAATQQVTAMELAQLRMNTALRNIPRNPTTTWTLQVNGMAQVTAAYQAIQNASGAHLNTVTSGGSTRSYWIGASGGWIPGPKGAPRPGIGHGGEYVLSADMLDGRQQVDPKVVTGLLSGGQHLVTGGGGASAAAAGVTVIVNVQGSLVDTQGLVQAIQTAMTRHGARNPQTYQPYQRR